MQLTRVRPTPNGLKRELTEMGHEEKPDSASGFVQFIAGIQLSGIDPGSPCVDAEERKR